jgi:hypothetical protein
VERFFANLKNAILAHRAAVFEKIRANFSFFCERKKRDKTLKKNLTSFKNFAIIWRCF